MGFPSRSKLMSRAAIDADRSLRAQVTPTIEFVIATEPATLRTVTERSAPAYSSRVDTLSSSSQTDQLPDRLAKSPDGESSKTSQRRSRKLRWWRRSGGRRRRAAHVWNWKSLPAPSSRFFGGLGKGQPAKVVRSLGSVAARCKERTLVGLQKLNP
jgi:hypothetical protein